MSKLTKFFVAFFLVTGVAFVALVSWTFHEMEKRHKYLHEQLDEPSSSIYAMIDTDLGYIATYYGLVYQTTEQYTASSFGRVVKPVAGEGFRYKNWRIKNLKVSAKNVHKDEFDFHVSLQAKSSAINWIRLPKVDYRVKLDQKTRTVQMLRRTLSGATAWDDLKKNLYLYSVVKKHTILLNQLPPDSRDLNIPSLPFQLPRTQKEMKQYKDWLIYIVGSESMLVDGWGRKIRMRVTRIHSNPVFTVRSAGPNGNWYDKDDMLISRDANTGRVLKTQNLPDNKESH